MGRYLTTVCLVGLYAYYRQLRYGLIVTSMRDYVSREYLHIKLCIFCGHKPGRFFNNRGVQVGGRHRLPALPRSLPLQPLFLLLL